MKLRPLRRLAWSSLEECLPILKAEALDPATAARRRSKLRALLRLVDSAPDRALIRWWQVLRYAGREPLLDKLYAWQRLPADPMDADLFDRPMCNLSAAAARTLKDYVDGMRAQGVKIFSGHRPHKRGAFVCLHGDLAEATRVACSLGLKVRFELAGHAK